MNIRQAHSAVLNKLRSVANDSSVEGDTKPIVDELDTALGEASKGKLTDLPHVRGNEESYQSDPMVFRISAVVVEGSPALIRKAVAQLELGLIEQGGKVKSEIQATATGHSSWVSMTVDMNDVKV